MGGRLAHFVFAQGMAKGSQQEALFVSSTPAFACSGRRVASFLLCSGARLRSLAVRPGNKLQVARVARYVHTLRGAVARVKTVTLSLAWERQSHRWGGHAPVGRWFPQARVRRVRPPAGWGQAFSVSRPHLVADDLANRARAGTGSYSTGAWTPSRIHAVVIHMWARRFLRARPRHIIWLNATRAHVSVCPSVCKASHVG